MFIGDKLFLFIMSLAHVESLLCSTPSVQCAIVIHVVVCNITTFISVLNQLGLNAVGIGFLRKVWIYQNTANLKQLK